MAIADGGKKGRSRKGAAASKIPNGTDLRLARAARLRAVRDGMQWSNKKMSEQTGLPEPLLSQYINGRKGITPDNAWRIAKATGLTLDYIYFGERRGLDPLPSWLPAEP